MLFKNADQTDLYWQDLGYRPIILQQGSLFPSFFLKPDQFSHTDYSTAIQETTSTCEKAAQHKNGI